MYVGSDLSLRRRMTASLRAATEMAILARSAGTPKPPCFLFQKHSARTSQQIRRFRLICRICTRIQPFFLPFFIGRPVCRIQLADFSTNSKSNMGNNILETQMGPKFIQVVRAAVCRAKIKLKKH